MNTGSMPTQVTHQRVTLRELTPAKAPKGWEKIILIKPFTCLLLALIFSPACLANHQSLVLPDGWREIENVVRSEDWRAENPMSYCSARGDFDGDEVQDTAILASNSKGELGILVWLSSTQPKPMLLQPARELPVYVKRGESLGIKALPPGEYQTLCGKNYRDCLEDEPESVSIGADSILFFKEGSWGDIFFFNPSTKNFKMISHSD